MVHNAGIYGAGKLCGAEAVILADEIIAYTRNAMKPLQVTEAGLAEAISMITEAGPLGEYVSKDHTLAHFRDFWYPTMFGRGMFDPLSAEPGMDLFQRLNERARQVINKHQPDLSEETIAEINTLEASWYDR
jgi:trimethylamine--corrinoid protein Co-methyltransferase